MGGWVGGRTHYQYSRSPRASSTQTMTMAMHRAQPTSERPDMKEAYLASWKKAMAWRGGWVGG